MAGWGRVWRGGLVTRAATFPAALVMELYDGRRKSKQLEVHPTKGQ